jgi:protein-glutamine gamma-glutamyltransferase
VGCKNQQSAISIQQSITVSFNTYFRASSYSMLAVATLSLVWAGALHWSLGIAFCATLMVSWRFEDSRWQITERTGLLLVLISIPVFYFDWTYQSSSGFRFIDDWQTKALVGSIAHLIVALSLIKLFQVKADRDWVFIYLISFFEILLAAGLSFSPIFLASLGVYLVCAVSTIVAFEIHKARRALKPVETRLLISRDTLLLRKLARLKPARRNTEIRRLPVVSVVFLVLICALALPLFLVAPRSGSAMFTRGGSGLSNFVGFSESVQLGEIGTLKENDQVVMHVRIEEQGNKAHRELRWRGVALDEFTGRGWKKSVEARRSERRVDERCGNGGTGCGVYQLDTADPLHRLTTQTVFLEPLDVPVIFAAPRAVAVQGPFPFVRQDAEGSIQSRRHEYERLIYKAVSDTSTPDPDILRRDRQPYPAYFKRYLQLPPTLNPEIAQFALATIVNADARNVYDAASAIETALRTDYSYSLEMKASGPDPLADFLFNVRQGHCEYFSTAMAVMLRTQNIPARVVNGFLSGEYNEAADAYNVRQSDAHSWVEVYFAESDSWVTFDPTPAAGRMASERSGLTGLLGKYADAFELMWFQYVIGYDKQEQRSLATSLNNRLFKYRRNLADELFAAKKLPQIGWQRVLALTSLAVALVLLTLLVRRIIRLGWHRALRPKAQALKSGASAVEFYERLTRVLVERGFKREPEQTPMEFAAKLGWSEVIRITELYNRVRYGQEKLSGADSRQIEQWLERLRTG